MSTIFSYQGELTVHTCLTCGIDFGIPTEYDDSLLENHKNFCCPNGHQQHYTAESDAKKYKRLYEQKKQCCELKMRQLKTAKSSYHGLKGYVSKLKKQLQEGGRGQG